MSNSEKSILYGILGAIFFFIATLCLIPIGNIIIPGDEYTLSYFMFIYMGMTLLAGIIITCTFMIINKMKELKNVLDKQ